MSGLHYAGIGSRETPPEMREVIHPLVLSLREKGYVMRSGGAPGADFFFEEFAGAQKEIYLPWKGFNGNESPLYKVGPKAMELGEKYHPAWDKLNYKVRLLIARNSYQVLGADLNTPSKFIVCWTPEGKSVGGTSQAIRIAKAYNIPVYNLFHDDAVEKIMRQVNVKPLF